MNKKLISWMLALLLIAPAVLSIGITPGRTTIDFNPNDHREFSFRVINSEYKEMTVALSVEGELKDYIKLPENVVTFTSEEYSKQLTFKVNLPDDIGSPGIHEAKIIAVELPKNQEGKTSVRAIAAVATQVRVKVPYPGKYIEANLEVASQDNKTVFFVTLSNLGTDDIKRAKASIDVIDPLNKTIVTVETTESSIRSKQRVDIAGSTTVLKPGAYKAVMHITYDEESLTQEKNFEIGNIWIDVREIFVRNFRLGDIAKFNILVESMWNELIEDVYAQLVMQTKDEDIVADVKSASFDIDPEERKTVFAYWDTEDVQEGQYYGKIVLHYEGRTTEKSLRTYVKLDGIEVLDITAAAVRLEPGKGVDKQAVLTILVLIVIMSNIAWFVYFKRKQGKNER
jgi:P pilus assembly chaperone PapD